MKRIATVLAALSVLLSPASALAQSATCQAYDPQLCGVIGGAEGTSSSATATGTMPFTGLDVVLLVGVAAAFLVVGVVVRARIERLG